MRYQTQQTAGFTLIELLVVISIIALLIALLLPALSQSRYQARIVQCQSVLRGIAIGQTTYANDHDFFFPVVGKRIDQADLAAGTEPRDWGKARQAGGQIRSWELAYTSGVLTYDLRPTYREYLGGDLDKVMECPLATDWFTTKNEQSLNSYMLYTTNNFRVKHFSFQDEGAYEKLDTRWAPDKDSGDEPSVNFTMLASDFTFGNYSGGLPLSTHPAPSGSPQWGNGANDQIGYQLFPGDRVPLNYANGDGSVRSFAFAFSGGIDTTQWVVNDHFAGKSFILPRDLASY